MRSFVKPCLWAAAIALPCLEFLRGNHAFSADSMNHMWLIEHFGAHIREHSVPPFAITSQELGGMPYPVFYGFMFYPVIGLLASLLGMYTALRIAVFGIVALQFFLVRRAILRTGRSEDLASSIACLTIWAIYPLTNLCNRGAITEFFATGFLTCAVCQWFAFLQSEVRAQQMRAGLEVGLFVAFAAACHPITALYGSALFVLISPTVCFQADRALIRSRLKALIPSTLLTVVILAPWVYAYALFRRRLNIGPVASMYVIPGIDDWWVRLLPFPLDVRTIGTDSAIVSTPHLDAQMNIPILCVLMAILWKLWRLRERQATWLLIPLSILACSFWMSIDFRPYFLLPSLFSCAQFVYRLVTYINLAMLFAIFIGCLLLARGNLQTGPSVNRIERVFLSMLLLVAGIGVGIKLGYIHRIDAGWVAEAKNMPYSFYGANAYSTPSMYKQLESNEDRKMVRFETSTLGVFEPLVVDLDEPSIVVTQVQPFPWNAFYVDGVRLPRESLRVFAPSVEAIPKGEWWSRPPYAGMVVPAGRHVIAFQNEPRIEWLIMYWTSAAAVLVGTSIVVAWNFLRALGVLKRVGPKDIQMLPVDAQLVSLRR